MKYKAQISITLERNDEAESVFLAVDVDNVNLPQGLECSAELVEGTSMLFTIGTDKGIPTLRATVDDLLKSAETAYKVLRALE